MSNASVYTAKKECDLRDMINQIMHVAKVSAAGTDSAYSMEDMDYSYCAVFEVIYALANNAYDVADEMMDELEKLNKVT